MTHTLSFQSRAASPAARAVKNVARFVLHYGEMVLAMYVGMLIYMPLQRFIPTMLQQAGLALFMAWPMVVWMRLRGHGWRHGIEMSFAMLVPWAILLAASTVITVLASVADSAMYLGMLAYMLVRREQHTGGAHHDHAMPHSGSQPRRHLPWRRIFLVAAYVGAIRTLAGVLRRA